MAEGSQDVAATLGELERKLKAIERELASHGEVEPAPGGPTPGGAAAADAPPAGATPVPPPPPPGATPVPPPAPAYVAEWSGGEAPPAWSTPSWAPAPPPPPGAGLRAHLDELQRVRGQLVDVADRLVAELSRAVGELEGAAEPRFEGRVLLEAGRFRDLSTLAAFEQALRRLPAARDVHVRSLDDGHARIELDLDRPTALPRELLAHSPVRFTVRQATPGHLVLAVDG